MAVLPNVLFFPLILSLSSGFPVNQFAVSSDRLVDMTHQLDDKTLFWPSKNPLSFSLTTIMDGYNEKGTYYRSKWFKSPEHGGTHLDAPSHFSKEGLDVGEMSLDQLFGPAVVINVTEQASSNADYAVSVRDILEWEATNGPVPQGAFVLLNSGWGSKWPNATQVFGSESLNDSSTFHFPSFHANATRFLVLERNIRGLGIDTPSIDSEQDTTHETHVLLAKHGRVGLENVASLDKMPLAGSFVFVMPMKISGGSGAPARIVGMLPK